MENETLSEGKSSGCICIHPSNHFHYERCRKWSQKVLLSLSWQRKIANGKQREFIQSFFVLRQRQKVVIHILVHIFPHFN